MANALHKSGNACQVSQTYKFNWHEAADDCPFVYLVKISWYSVCTSPLCAVSIKLFAVAKGGLIRICPSFFFTLGYSGQFINAYEDSKNVLKIVKRTGSFANNSNQTLKVAAQQTGWNSKVHDCKGCVFISLFWTKITHSLLNGVDELLFALIISVCLDGVCKSVLGIDVQGQQNVRVEREEEDEDDHDYLQEEEEEQYPVILKPNDVCIKKIK